MVRWPLYFFHSVARAIFSRCHPLINLRGNVLMLLQISRDSCIQNCRHKCFQVIAHRQIKLPNPQPPKISFLGRSPSCMYRNSSFSRVFLGFIEFSVFEFCVRRNSFLGYCCCCCCRQLRLTEVECYDECS